MDLPLPDVPTSAQLVPAGTCSEAPCKGECPGRQVGARHLRTPRAQDDRRAHESGASTAARMAGAPAGWPGQRGSQSKHRAAPGRSPLTARAAPQRLCVRQTGGAAACLRQDRSRVAPQTRASPGASLTADPSRSSANMAPMSTRLCLASRYTPPRKLRGSESCMARRISSVCTGAPSASPPLPLFTPGTAARSP